MTATLTTKNQLKRYDEPRGDHYGMEPTPDGDYVRFEEYEKLRTALEDISMGASMMLDSPIMNGVHKYASEVRRVANLALTRDAT